MLTPEELERITDEASQAVVASLKDRIVERILSSTQWHLEATVSESVKNFVDNEVAPSVTEHLMSSKDGIIKAACDVADSTSSLFAEAMRKTIETKLTDEWKRRQILKALFE